MHRMQIYSRFICKRSCLYIVQVLPELSANKKELNTRPIDGVHTKYAIIIDDFWAISMNYPFRRNVKKNVAKIW